MYQYNGADWVVGQHVNTATVEATLSFVTPAENETITSPSWPGTASTPGSAVLNRSSTAVARTCNGGPETYIVSSGIHDLWLCTTRVFVSLMPNRWPWVLANSFSSVIRLTARSNGRSSARVRASWVSWPASP